MPTRDTEPADLPDLCGLPAPTGPCTRELFHHGYCHHEQDFGQRWCRTCRSRVQVMDESAESIVDRHRERAVWVVHLECGHDLVYEGADHWEHAAYEPL